MLFSRLLERDDEAEAEGEDEDDPDQECEQRFVVDDDEAEAEAEADAASANWLTHKVPPTASTAASIERVFMGGLLSFSNENI